MSELTQCNYCSLEDTKYQARKSKMKITMLPSTRSEGLEGIDIYIHPKEVRLKNPISEGDHKKYFKSWMWEITDHCVC
ncbi:MAG TPA: hypothetical protein VF849_00170 [Blattabacteriaceae bacterium]